MTFTPGRFQNPGAYGWSNTRATYEGPPITGRTDVGNYAYERFRADDQFGSGFSSSNPQFSSDAAGRLIPTVHFHEDDAIPGGTPARILRGFIRRADYDASDPVSRSRLYFMYNPTIIARDYVSYLDQGALDPFNTVFQSTTSSPHRRCSTSRSNCSSTARTRLASPTTPACWSTWSTSTSSSAM